MEWMERQVQEARARLDLTGQPTEADLLRLLDLYGVQVVHAPVSCASCVRTQRGPTIILPRQWRGEENDRVTAHECGHALTHPGGGNVLRYLWPNNPRVERLARLWDARDEAYADAFVSAWFGGDPE